MKKTIIIFFKRQKKILFLMGVTFILFMLNIFSLFLVFINRPEAVNEFIRTSEITREILPITILSFIGMGLGIILLILVMLFVIKTIIPDMKAVADLMMKDEAKFLFDLPGRIKKEVLKNGK